MVASSESPSWRRLDNGVQEKIAPPTSPTPHFPDKSPTNDLNDPMLPSSSGIMKNLDEPAVFAVPAVPKKASKKIQPLTPSTAVVRSKSRKNAHKKSRVTATASKPSTTAGVHAGTTNEATVGSPARKKPRREPGTDAVKKMFVCLKGVLGKHHPEDLHSLKHRLSRLGTFMVNRAGDDTLKTGTSSFHDFLNRESYKPDTKSSLSFSFLGDESFRTESAFSSPKRKGRNEDGASSSSMVISSRSTEQQSMQDLFGVLSVSRDDMKNKTPSQLVEFVKRVESNQRREAFEKQQRPAYLLKLARTQSVDRAKMFSGVAQGFQRAVDRINDDAWVTDSSSGGESADEAEEELFQKKFDQDRLIPVDQRALYRYATTRQGIASRYSYAHRQLARAEYAYQVTGNLLQRIQQRQGIVTFGGGTADDSKPLLKTAFLAHKGPTPRPWDDREVVSVAKTANCSTVLRLPTAKSDAGQSLHPGPAGLFRRKMKVALPSTGLNIPFETYEATMWKERLAVGRIIEDGSDDEEMGEAEGEQIRELSEAVVSSARGCARARPLMAFKKRVFVDMDAYPPKRYQMDEKPRHCDCSTRCLLPDLVGPVSCAICMGLLPMPTFSSHTNLLRTPRSEAMALVDPGYHPRLSQPSIRALDAELSGVSLDFDPAMFISSRGPFKPRPMRRQRALDLIKTEAEAAHVLRKQEERLRAERERLRALRFGALENNRDTQKRPKNSKTVSDKKQKAHRSRTISTKNRKRRHSSVSSDTTVSSAVSHLTRSTSVGSTDMNVVTSKNATKRQMNRTTSKSETGKNHPAGRRREARSDLTSFVIPYGMTAPSKIEKIQYKEIIVPKFRDLKTVPLVPHGAEVVDAAGEAGDQSLPKLDTIQPPLLPTDVEVDNSCEDEDLSDAAFAERHIKCEVEERTRFTVPEKQTRKRNPPPEGTAARPPPVKSTRRKKSLLHGKKVSKKSSKVNRYFGRNDVRKKVKGEKKVPDGEEGGGVVVMASAEQPPPMEVKVQTATVKRPRKTPEEIAAMNAQRPARPVRTRRSTFRASPDDEDG
ncbi:uncharacterized protein LOC129583231 [Paramacrobiotus metropolitanus]|uniref:uncharacterized protein LOC129583231 n=1 Tax=Paramacrobiotus metropolitanus TaxID=2943436 RepID=UPI00244597A0|nr:uncharacterized protein LOC129583231 [Paramacrobiotus metropolitanus]XP_055330914.1 uncharacterized protein LOC129583231 [Paramacrobiotus metropolitanus]